MSERPPLPPGPYLVVGLARSGTAAARLLRDHGRVIACDNGSPPVRDLDGVDVKLGTDGLELLDGVRTVVKSPGVPRSAPVVAAARSAGLEVTGELEVAWRLLANEFVAITGTNGKTTTTELLGAIHREAGVPVAVAGNVGTPLASLVGELPPDAVVVAECSSFQLEDSIAFAPEAAALLNLEPDHLDRHGTLADYRAAKLRVFANQRDGDIAVVPVGFAEPRGSAEPQLPGAADVVLFGGDGADLTLRSGALAWRGERLIATDEIRLHGAHNVANAMAAAAVALARGLDRDAVRAALTTFAGVEHRLEEVVDRDGVLYVNDSKATNVASTRVALEAFDGGVHAILGGRGKPGGFRPLRDLVRQRCRGVYLVGEAAPEIARDLADTVELVHAGDLASALAAARRAARPGEIILLSPACASYDQYDDYEARGRHFKDLVLA